jgi:DHA3 family macrolide efflux protein-like MFS transporter
MSKQRMSNDEGTKTKVAHSYQVRSGWARPFFTIWMGQAISLLGSQLVQFALIWYLTKQTESAMVLATASLVGLLPQVVLGPVIGTLIDRWNRRVTIIVSDSVIALATLVLAYLFGIGAVQIWMIYLLMFVRSLAGGFHGPAMMASTSLMVPKEQLTRVQGFSQMLYGGMNIVSAPLGAVLLGVMPLQGILMIDVGTALLAITPLFFIPVPEPARRPAPERAQTGPLTVWRDFREGLGYVMAWPGLRMLIGMALMINFVLPPASSLMPLLVTEHFGGDALQLGWINSALGVGVIAGGLILGTWGGFKRRILTTLVGLLGMGLSYLVIGFTPATLFSLALFAVFLGGAMASFVNGPVFAIFQATIEPAMQGRVITLVSSLGGAMAPVGLILAGPIADIFGIQIWYIMSGGVVSLMGIAGYFIPAILNIESNNGKAAEALGVNAERISAEPASS